MDRSQFDRIGRELRNLGHRRRELVEAALRELEAGNREEAARHAAALAAVTMQCMELMSRQHGILEGELSRVGTHAHLPTSGPDLHAARTGDVT